MGARSWRYGSARWAYRCTYRCAAPFVAAVFGGIDESAAAAATVVTARKITIAVSRRVFMTGVLSFRCRARRRLQGGTSRPNRQQRRFDSVHPTVTIDCSLNL